MIGQCSIIIGQCTKPPLQNWICPRIPSMWIGVCIFPIAHLSMLLLCRLQPQHFNHLNPKLFMDKRSQNATPSLSDKMSCALSPIFLFFQERNTKCNDLSKGTRFPRHNQGLFSLGEFEVIEILLLDKYCLWSFSRCSYVFSQ